MDTPETSEKKAIKQYLDWKGVFYYHNLASFGSYKGIPDITAIKNGVCYQIEVKSKSGKKSENQVKFEQNWLSHGGIYICGGLDSVMKYL